MDPRTQGGRTSDATRRHARAKGHLKGKQPKLSTTQRKLLFDVQDRGEYTQTEIAELFNVSRATVYRELQRRRVAFLATCEAHIF
jgi:DNA invertase Pin-like site-specific DNA recombinase